MAADQGVRRSRPWSFCGWLGCLARRRDLGRHCSASLELCRHHCTNRHRVPDLGRDNRLRCQCPQASSVPLVSSQEISMLFFLSSSHLCHRYELLRHVKPDSTRIFPLIYQLTGRDWLDVFFSDRHEDFYGSRGAHLCSQTWPNQESAPDRLCNAVDIPYGLDSGGLPKRVLVVCLSASIWLYNVPLDHRPHLCYC